MNTATVKEAKSKVVEGTDKSCSSVHSALCNKISFEKSAFVLVCMIGSSWFTYWFNFNNKFLTKPQTQRNFFAIAKLVIKSVCSSLFFRPNPDVRQTVEWRRFPGNLSAKLQLLYRKKNFLYTLIKKMYSKKNFVIVRYFSKCGLILQIFHYMFLILQSS